MIPVLNFITSVLSTRLAAIMLAWLLLWTYRKFLRLEMEQSVPEAANAQPSHALTKDIGRYVAEINAQLRDVSRKLLIDGELKTVVTYREVIK